jgi:DNA-binding LacI/PurR family transcriptional regulator/DNA-binding transcriptional regulator YhcF (GntR family)
MQSRRGTTTEVWGYEATAGWQRRLVRYNGIGITYRINMPLLYEQICERISGDIASGRLHPGDQLPTEQEYAASLAVSRITVRRAMTQLQRDGLIERFRGKGTFVTQAAPRLARPASPGPAPERNDAIRPRRIGFIVPAISDLFGVMMLNGIDDRCQECGIDLSLRRSHGDIELEAQTMASWIASGVDGIIVFPSYGEFYNETLVRAVLNGFPVVLVDRTLSGIPVPSVLTDHYEASRALTRWLVADRHDVLAFVSPAVHGTSSLEERQRGFRDALQEATDRPRQTRQLILDSVVPGRSTAENYERDRERIRAFLVEHPDVTGILASEYGVALLIDGAISGDQELRERGIRVACFDSLVESMTTRSFPHIRQNELEIGRQAVDLLLAQWDGARPTGRHYVPFDLVTNATPQPI